MQSAGVWALRPVADMSQADFHDWQTLLEARTGVVISEQRRAFLQTNLSARMRELALTEFGCLSFHAVTEGHSEVALSYWPDEAAIRAWKNHPEHLLAQQQGRDRWYTVYSVEVAEIRRAYAQPAP